MILVDAEQVSGNFDFLRGSVSMVLIYDDTLIW
jgi:hypothetical protein